MIICRIVTALRQQEQATIAIEFVIVMVGIFAGLQVADWSDARKELNAMSARRACVLQHSRGDPAYSVRMEKDLIPKDGSTNHRIYVYYNFLII